jgi:hypothetical protein
MNGRQAVLMSSNIMLTSSGFSDCSKRHPESGCRFCIVSNADVNLLLCQYGHARLKLRLRALPQENIQQHDDEARADSIRLKENVSLQGKIPVFSIGAEFSFRFGTKMPGARRNSSFPPRKTMKSPADAARRAQTAPKKLSARRSGR